MNKIKRLSLDYSIYRASASRRHDATYQFVPVSWPRQARQRVLNKQSGEYLEFEIRRKTTDWPVFDQVFLQEGYTLNGLRRAADLRQTYRNIVETGGTPLILDCGSNNGLSCAWFSQTYPESFVVGVEPEAANFEMATRNTQSLANVMLLKAAVAANDGELAVHDPGHGTSGYTTSNIIDNDTHSTIPAYSIASLIDLAARKNTTRNLVPFIVKVDIEGFEEDLFASNTDWIDNVPLMFIELHDWLFPCRLTAMNFIKAMASRRRDFVLRGENVISIACRDD